MSDQTRTSRLNRRKFFAISAAGVGAVALGVWEFQNSIARLLLKHFIDNRTFVHDRLVVANARNVC